MALPWYVKNAVQTGNPVYPLLFGAVNDDATRDVEAVLDGYGHGRSASDALLLPVRLLGDADAFDRGDLVSPLLWLFAPLALGLRQLRRVVVPVWLGIAAYLAAWFVGSQQARFLVPLMPVLALLAALAIVAVARAGRLGRLLTVTVVTGALVAGLGISTLYASRFVAVSAGFESQGEFLSRKAPYHDATAWVNRNLPRDARVLTDIRGSLYLERPSTLLVWDAVGAGRERRFRPPRSVRRAADHARSRARLECAAHRPGAAAGGRVVAPRDGAHRHVADARRSLGPPETFLVFAFR